MKKGILTAARSLFVFAIIGVTLFGSPRPVMADSGQIYFFVVTSGYTVNAATFSLTMGSFGDPNGVTVSFEYTSGTNAPQTTVPIFKAIPLPGESLTFTTTVKDLQPNTRYRVRPIVQGGLAGIYYSIELDFDSTPQAIKSVVYTPPAATPPVIETGAATAPGTTSATLNARLTSLGTGLSATVSFEYGLTDKYGNIVTVDSVLDTGDLSFTVSGLNPGTPYHFRAVAHGGTNGVSYGQDVTFVTAPAPGTAPLTSPVLTTATIPTGPPLSTPMTSAPAAPVNSRNSFYTGLALALGSLVALSVLILIIKTRNNGKP